MQSENIKLILNNNNNNDFKLIQIPDDLIDLFKNNKIQIKGIDINYNY